MRYRLGPAHRGRTSLDSKGDQLVEGMLHKLPPELAAAVRLGAKPETVMIARVVEGGPNRLEVGMCIDGGRWHIVWKSQNQRINGLLVYTAIKDRGWPIRTLAVDDCVSDLANIVKRQVEGSNA